MKIKDIITEAIVGASSPSSVPKYIDGINQILRSANPTLSVGPAGANEFRAKPGQQIKSLDDVIQGQGQDHLGKDVEQIQAKVIHKGPAIKGGIEGAETQFGNKGEVAEGILGCATLAKLITRPGREIIVDDVINVIKALPKQGVGVISKTVKEPEGQVSDNFQLTINLKQHSYASLVNTGLLLQKMSREIKSIVDYTNDAVRRYANMFEVNGRPDAVHIVSDGISNEVGTKTDVQMIYDNERGQRVIKHFDLSVKTGATKQMGQVGGGAAKLQRSERFEILKGLWDRFAVSIQPIKNEFLKAESIEQAYNLAYIYANDILQSKLEGNDKNIEENFLQKVIDGIKYFATLNDDRVKLVQFTQKGYYVLDFKRLDNLYDNDAIDLSSKYSTGEGEDGITIPKVTIYDKVSGLDLLTIRMYRAGSGYIRNYIEKEALLVQLTKVRGTK